MFYPEVQVLYTKDKVRNNCVAAVEALFRADDGTLRSNIGLLSFMRFEEYRPVTEGISFNLSVSMVVEVEFYKNGIPYDYFCLELGEGSQADFICQFLKMTAGSAKNSYFVQQFIDSFRECPIFYSRRFLMDGHLREKTFLWIKNIMSQIIIEPSEKVIVLAINEKMLSGRGAGDEMVLSLIA